MIKFLQQHFEGRLWRSRLPLLVVVIASGLMAFGLFHVTIVDVGHLLDRQSQWADPGLTTNMRARLELEIAAEGIAAMLDVYLTAVTMLIFVSGLYELLVNKNKLGEEEGLEFAARLFRASSVDELKKWLISVVLLRLVIGFFQQAFRLQDESGALDLVYLAVVILLIGSALYLSHRRGVARHWSEGPDKAIEENAMNERMKLLIAYDGSPCADAALADLQRAGLPDEVEAVVLSVADVWLPPSPEAGERSFPEQMPASVPERAQAVRALTKARFRAVQARRQVQADFPAWDVRYEACADSPAWAVVKKAWEWQPDLVVVGSRDHSALGRFIHGSVSQTVVTEARCSVRVARGRAGQHGSPVRIVIGVDGSPSAETVVQAVAARRWPAGSELRVITLIDAALSTATTLFLPTVRWWITESQKKEDACLYKMAEAAAKKLEAPGLSVSFCLKEGDPKRVLIEEAEHWGADCIFVGARGLSSLKRFFRGSVSTAVAIGARCSVEVVRPSQQLESVLRLNGQGRANQEFYTQDLPRVSA